MTNTQPDVIDIIALRLMHLDHLDTFDKKAREIINELRLYGYEIVRRTAPRSAKP